MSYHCIMWRHMFYLLFHFFQIRMSSRLLALSGIVLLFSFFHEKKPRPQHYRWIGERLMAMYFFCVFYSTIYSKEDSQALLLHYPGGETTQYLCATLAALGAIAYFTGYFILDISYTLVVFILINTLAIDCDIYYWTHRRGLDFWNQFRLLSDNLYIVLGIIMILSCSTNRVTVATPSPTKAESTKSTKKDK